MRITAIVALLTLASGLPATGQCWQKGNEPYEPEVNQLLKGSFSDLRARDPILVANAKRAFELTTSVEKKQRLASVLLSIGEKGEKYFDFLAGCARAAISNQTPWPDRYDTSGKTIGGFSQRFLQWCKTQHCNPSDERSFVKYQLPVPLLHLAAAGDSRSYPILLEGLKSENLMVVYYAALGIAKLGCRDGIGSVLSAARRWRGERRDFIALTLLFFPQEEAKKQARQMIANREILAVYEELADRPEGLDSQLGVPPAAQPRN